MISHHISKCQTPCTIWEKLIMPSVVTACSEVLRPAAAAKVKEIPLPNYMVCRRIDDMAADIEMQILERTKSSDWFAIQLDETMDLSNLAVLLVYIRYAHEGRFHEDFLFCKVLAGTTTAGEIFRMLDGYISGHGLIWGHCVGVCTDGAAAMTGRHNGVVARVKAVSPSVQATHCVIHREVLASKRLSTELHEVLNQVVKIVNLIKANPTNSRLFTALCDEMGADHVHLLLHFEVRWLSQGKVVNRVYELRHEVEAFLTNKQSNLADYLRDQSWLIKVAYLSDILDHFSMLNLSIQGQACDIFQANDKIMAFKKKLSVWTNRVNRGVFDMFGCLSSLADEGVDLGQVPAVIVQHLTETLRHFDSYFPSKSHLTQKQWVRVPFTNPETSALPPVVQDKLLELSCDAGLQLRFGRLSLSEFWLSCCDEYPQLSEMAVKTLMPFHSTYLCETAFSHLTATKTKHRNRLNSENTLRVALSPCLPRFDLLVARKQAHPSH
ncbi:SCAN domain-containing protein 3-like [Neoarius graeffei]|uniref:SCAN domain-containing protein 3-like n=1 Tax=Neoarius graeffei TaxID=443677 RepID=UPI00298C516F|nr:SCAN domain-containing protein 3-like [Neoarius graeffei]